MNHRKQFARRVAKARSAVAFAQIIERDDFGNVSEVVVPGSGAKLYAVSLRKIATLPHRGYDATLQATCTMQYSPLPMDTESLECRGNNVAACYHTMQAVMIALQNDHFRGIWCADSQSAAFQSLMKEGTIIRVVGENLDNPAYVVAHR